MSDPSDSHDLRSSLNPSSGSGISEFSRFSSVDSIPSGRPDKSPDKVYLLALVSPDRESSSRILYSQVIADMLVNFYSRTSPYRRMNPYVLVNLDTLVNPYSQKSVCPGKAGQLDNTGHHE